MKPSDELDSDIERLQRELDSKLLKRRNMQTSCPHTWGPISYVPEYHPAYTIPGDPPGSVGRAMLKPKRLRSG